MENKGNSERREYIRLDTVFPIEFQLVRTEDRNPISELYEGFTKNVGKGGMCIFAKTLKVKDKEFFNFVPHETKLKLIINIPTDKESIDCFATVEWVEKMPGPVLDTYLIGISYDFINELEHEKIIGYVKWLRLRPRLIFLTIVMLSVAVALTFGLLYNVNRLRIVSEDKLEESIAEGKRISAARIAAEKKKSKAETEFETVDKEYKQIQTAYEKLSEEKRTLEKISELSEEDNRELQLQLEDLAREKASLEEEIDKKIIEGVVEIEGDKEVPEIESGVVAISAERLKSEEVNYNKFRELILNEKILSLDAYISAHRSSVYHAAALFALAELRYKHGDRILAVVDYNEVIRLYARSKYALYSSHRIEQLNKNCNYGLYTLRDFYVTYRLPELFDYRDIEPYVR